ncbi:hypothetical protein CDCA_CDCA01G0151 [Cyanidium caldarium]|uniref:t-SNARE coiled-coil homology domain-containing protein n=1 Tax=Cyanidium caldarium TaxID=2771 RepID=A0AAV9IPJ5_CYACA|nr:hypothetical protein CDCA_CDCA01G0151 [Cyanidium caldarium]
MQDRLAELRGEAGPSWATGRQTPGAEATTSDRGPTSLTPLEEVVVHGERRQPTQAESKSAVPAPGEVEEDGEGSGASDALLVDFYGQVNRIDEEVRQLRGCVEQLEPLYEQKLYTVDISGSSAVDDAVDMLLGKSQCLRSSIQRALKDMADENKRFCTEHPSRTGEARVRINQHQRLIRQFMKVTEDFEHMQERQKQRMQMDVVRQLRVIQPDIGEQEIQGVLQEHQGVDEVLRSRMVSLRTVAVQTAVDDIEMRNRDILALEQSIQELHQMFLDLAVLVESQGELIEQVEVNVQAARTQVKRGVKNLVSARRLQRRSRMLLWCLVILLIILLAAIILPVVLTQTINN